MNKKQVLQVIYGGAVADAIGNPLEFKSVVTDADFIRSVNAPVLRISDDTQMSLFIYEALQTNSTLESALVNWYTTQTKSAPKGKRNLAARQKMLSFPVLYATEAPGGTCMASCRKIKDGIPVLNDSKGNGTVMRAATFAVDGFIKNLTDPAVYLKAKDDALLTHKHPYAWQSSVLLCGILLRLFRGAEFMHACYEAAAALPSCEEVSWLVLSMFNRADFDALRMHRSGWVAEEALALAVGSVANGFDYMSAVKLACQGVSSDSDTVAGIAGQLAVATGMQIPDGFTGRLNALGAIDYLVSEYLEMHF